MTLKQRDKRALAILAAAGLLIIILRFGLSEEAQTRVVAPSDSVAKAEKRLAKLRQLVASLPAREQDLRVVSADLAEREKGVIQAETAAQAQAQLLQVLRLQAGAQTPPIELRTAEMGQVRPLGDHYGEISLPVTFECRIEQLLNLLADVAAQPEILTTSELRISLASAKDKTVNVRLTVSGVAPRRLVPERKGLPSL